MCAQYGLIKHGVAGTPRTRDRTGGAFDPQSPGNPMACYEKRVQYLKAPFISGVAVSTP